MKRVLGYAMIVMVEVSLNLGGLNQLVSVSCALQLQGNEKSGEPQKQQRLVVLESQVS